MKFCSNCGTSLPDGASVCQKCGTPVATTPQQLNASSTSTNSSAIIAVIVGVVILVALLLGAYFLFLKDSSANRELEREAIEEAATMKAKMELMEEKMDELKKETAEEVNAVKAEAAKKEAAKAVAPLKKVSTDNFAWLSYTRLNYSHISGLSGSDLRILRNAIYARHGYIFKDKSLRDYFNQYSWYNPRYNDVSGALNDIEKANVQFIRSHE